MAAVTFMFESCERCVVGSEQQGCLQPVQYTACLTAAKAAAANTFAFYRTQMENKYLRQTYNANDQTSIDQEDDFEPV